MFGFKKRPENDIWQYYVNTVIKGKDDKCLHEANVGIFIVKTCKKYSEFTPMHNGRRYKEPSFGGGKPSICRALTVKQACKFCKKHKLILQVDPDDSYEIFEYFAKHLPRECWEYNSLSKYARFN